MLTFGIVIQDGIRKGALCINPLSISGKGNRMKTAKEEYNLLPKLMVLKIHNF